MTIPLKRFKTFQESYRCSMVFASSRSRVNIRSGGGSRLLVTKANSLSESNQRESPRHKAVESLNAAVLVHRPG
jgi:hypothetical protein